MNSVINEVMFLLVFSVYALWIPGIHKSTMCIGICAQICTVGCLLMDYYKKPRIFACSQINWKEIQKAFHISVGNYAISYFAIQSFLTYSYEFNTTLCSILTYPMLYILADGIFYATHRACHQSIWLFRIHKVHHQWKDTHATQAFACHPLEHIFVNLSAVLLPPLVLQMSYGCSILFILHATINSICSHSGHIIWPKILTADPHDYHHYLWNCEYGAGGWFDQWFRTNKLKLLAAKGQYKQKY